MVGVSSKIAPVTIASGMAAFDIPVMTAVMAALAYMVFRLKEFSRNAGLAMLGVYALYVATLLTL